MGREIIITGITLHANGTTCYHHCRYCQLRSYKTSGVLFPRYLALIERFVAWRAAHRPDFEIWPWFGNSDDHDDETLEGVQRIDEMQNWVSRNALLGGVAHRTRTEMREWLEKRRRLGVDTIVATFSGHGDKHDYWNNMPGNYQFQMETLRLARDMGFRLQQRVILLRDNLASLEALFDELDGVGGADSERWSLPLFYSGLARRLEAERLTRSDFEMLSPRVRASLRSDYANWRSEREWIEFVRSTPAEAEEMAVDLRLDEEALSWAEARSCEEVVVELSEKWRTAYHAAPSRQELCLVSGDERNDRVYFNVGQMEKAWFDRYRTTGNCDFDLRSTHFF
ncbi:MULTISPECIES: radical SAM protein [Methylosinus]|uniref:Radical SAM core domain-containing protein n=1 Tax=Methylosinus trichosporium (strain ATCC 35070 / NCIMB 11131 / UNIQEM 75 / OB3b) TaxID=595536 RepID=A0A2D2CXH8_METT3|nr:MULTISPECIES: radical SAM protein [Methylosinus]ATQ67452.1 hypothetical protein CQW49_05745 [Methylosinus trichosporium OB3b]OBS50888.1 hypothetical protein A8B73_19185 [Methylosinus sp. 3S-1]